VLTYPQEHDVSFAGVGIGAERHLPPTLTLQYHIRLEGDFRPYVGAGINYNGSRSLAAERGRRLSLLRAAR
jgi:outer membrane protein